MSEALQVSNFIAGRPRTIFPVVLCNADTNTVNAGAIKDMSVITKETVRLKAVLSEKERLLQSVMSSVNVFNIIATDHFKGMLESMYMRLEFLLKGEAKNLSDNGKGNLRKMQAGIQKIKLLTKDIIYISGLYQSVEQREAVYPKQICSILSKSLREKLEEANLELVCDALPPLTGSPLMIVQLATHIIDHAAKNRNISERGIMKISCGEEMRINNELDTKQKLYRLSFTYEGAAFAEDEKNDMFNILAGINNSKSRRGGMNLPAAKIIMELHDGDITAECSGNEYAFHCFFPVNGDN